MRLLLLLAARSLVFDVCARCSLAVARHTHTTAATVSQDTQASGHTHIHTSHTSHGHALWTLAPHLTRVCDACDTWPA